MLVYSTTPWRGFANILRTGRVFQPPSASGQLFLTETRYYELQVRDNFLYSSSGALGGHESLETTGASGKDGWNARSNGALRTRGYGGHIMGLLDYGAMFRVGNQNLCESCAVKKLGIETLPSTEKADILRPFTMGGGK